MRNIWIEKRNGITYDFCGEGLGDTVIERFESLWTFLINTSQSLGVSGHFDIIIGKEIFNLFEDIKGHIPNYNFYIIDEEFHFIGRLGRVNLFTSNVVSDAHILMDLFTKWQRIKVKGLY